ncbi:MAG: hypothetical protein NTW42_06090 [Deltaproteobacteria bacterium]|nr:hypothetical protein [Deltaproteobacteria bacterium]
MHTIIRQEVEAQPVPPLQMRQFAAFATGVHRGKAFSLFPLLVNAHRLGTFFVLLAALRCDGASSGERVFL